MNALRTTPQSERATSIAIRTVLTSTDTTNKLFELNPKVYCKGVVIETPDKRVDELAHLMIMFHEPTATKEEETTLFNTVVSLSLASDVKPEIKDFLSQLVAQVQKTQETLLDPRAKL